MWIRWRTYIIPGYVIVWFARVWSCGHNQHVDRDKKNTIMSLLEVPDLIEAPPKWSASCHKIVACPHNGSTWHFWYKLYRIHTQIHCSDTTSVAQGHHDGHDNPVYLVWACLSNHMWVTLYKRPHGARNRGSLKSVLVLGASIRDITVVTCSLVCHH